MKRVYGEVREVSDQRVRIIDYLQQPRVAKCLSGDERMSLQKLVHEGIRGVKEDEVDEYDEGILSLRVEWGMC